MDRPYNEEMDIETKSRLARYADMGQVACAIRLYAARIVAGVGQETVAQACGIRKQAYSNMETARSFPTRTVMQYYYRLHRIDFNFLMHGDFAQLPADLQGTLFSALERANSEWDQKERLDQRQSASPQTQRRTAQKTSL